MDDLRSGKHNCRSITLAGITHDERCLYVADEIERLRKQISIMQISVEAMAEVKASVDGESSQPVRDIVYGALDEINSLSTPHKSEPDR